MKFFSHLCFYFLSQLPALVVEELNVKLGIKKLMNVLGMVLKRITVSVLWTLLTKHWKHQESRIIKFYQDRFQVQIPMSLTSINVQKLILMPHTTC